MEKTHEEALLQLTLVIPLNSASLVVQPHLHNTGIQNQYRNPTKYKKTKTGV